MAKNEHVAKNRTHGKKKREKFSNGISVANKTNGWQIKRTCGKKNEGKKNAPPCTKFKMEKDLLQSEFLAKLAVVQILKDK